MKDPQIPVAGFQDAGSGIPEVLPAGVVMLYHTHGWRQYMGTCKFHLEPDCRHLRHWLPSKTFGPTKAGERMSKTIMREAHRPEGITVGMRCKTCWPAEKYPYVD